MSISAQSTGSSRQLRNRSGYINALRATRARDALSDAIVFSIFSMYQSNFPLMPGCRHLQSGRPLLSDVLISNVAEQQTVGH